MTVSDYPFGLYWCRPTRGDSVVQPQPVRIAKCEDNRKIHGKHPAESKVVLWIGSEAPSSLEECLAEGWVFTKLERPVLP
jgi:hypothetical protein